LKAARDWLLTVALGMITGGILGNLYDRLGLWGGQNASGETIHAVRDWILIAYGGFNVPLLGEKWPNFNIADTLLVCGAGLLIWHAFTATEPAKSPAGEPTSKSLVKN
jgi:signal peptidase II